MFDKAILGVYKGELYSKQSVKNSKMFYNYYIFDMANGCSFIAQRVTNTVLPLGEGLYNIMSQEQVKEVVRHATSYTETPLFVRTSHGVALVLPHLTPSSSLGVLVFTHFNGDNLMRIYKHMKWDAVYGIGTKDIPYKYSKTCIKYTPLAEELRERIHSAFHWVTSAYATVLCGDITDHLENKIYALSYFTGCPVGLVCNERIDVVGEFDLPMFISFLLVMYTAVCNVSPKFECSVALSKSDDEVELRVDFVADSKNIRKHPTVIALKHIVERKRMCLVPFAEDNIVRFKLYPTVKDWALLGIKSPDNTEPDDEL